jgi:hypothetical protein
MNNLVRSYNDELCHGPSMVPHGIANTGDETLKVVGFFCNSHIVSTFDEPLQPMGQSSLTQGAPVAA